MYIFLMRLLSLFILTTCFFIACGEQDKRNDTSDQVKKNNTDADPATVKHYDKSFDWCRLMGTIENFKVYCEKDIKDFRIIPKPGPMGMGQGPLDPKKKDEPDCSKLIEKIDARNLKGVVSGSGCREVKFEVTHVDNSTSHIALKR